MSRSAHNWARDLQLEPRSSTLKSILKELGDFENGTGETWVDLDTLQRFTDLNRKTLIAGLAELKRRGVIEDTGKRHGSTKQIPIYRLVGYVSDFESSRREAEKQAAKSTENGTLSTQHHQGGSDPSQVTDSSTGSNCSSDQSTGSAKGSQYRNRSDSGTVPDSGGKSTDFGSKGSQYRDPNGSNRVLTQDARTPARQGARAAPAEPRLPDPAQLRAYWHRQAVSALEDALRQEAWQHRIGGIGPRTMLAQMPPRIRQLAQIALDRILDEWGAAEWSKANQEAVELAVRAEANSIVGVYHEGIAA